MKRLEVRRLLIFCMVGAIGFVVDAGGLAIMLALGSGPYLARGISAPLAILATFLLNRYVTFSSYQGNLWLAFVRYVSSQALGLCCNLLVYALALSFAPHPLDRPLLCLALASGVALVVNYLGSRFFVFVNPKQPDRGAI